MASADYGRRLSETRRRMSAAGLDGLVISNPSNRRYLTGFTPKDGDITESSGWVLVTPKSLGVIAGPFFFPGLEHEIAASGAEVLLADGKLFSDLVAERAQVDGVTHLGFEQEWLSYFRYDFLKKKLPDTITLTPSDDLIRHVRAVKDAGEIEQLRRAADVGDRAFRELVTRIRVGMTEREVASTLEQIMQDLGAEGPSFPTIVGAGPGSALPHWEPTDRDLRAGEPILIDFGVIVDGYCSDSTRTFCIGEPEPQLVGIYSAVRAAQDATVDALRSGVRRGRDVDAAARKVLEDAGYGDKFIHGLGHGIGLAVHELPSMGRLRVNTPEMDAELAKNEQVEDGAVVTNEPGVYLNGWGGVRLEDMLLVTKEGAEVISERNPEQIISLPVR
jgi:Xaa-Pro aminopeptidase